MKCSRWLLLWVLFPVSALAVTFVDVSLHGFECLDRYLYFKLLMWGPVVEELVFRAGLQTWLSRKIANPHFCNGLVSLVFALMHYASSGNLWSLTVFVPSIALGWTYQKTQSLACTIGLHILFNGLFLLLVC